MVTAASYALCAVAAWLLRGRGDDWRSTLMVSTLMTAFCTRELDWHKPVTGTSVLRVSWHAGLASPQAKITAALALAALLGAPSVLLLRGLLQHRAADRAATIDTCA